MTWFDTVALVGLFLLIGGFAITRIDALSGDDYINEVLGYALIIIAVGLGVIAGVGWIAS